MKLGIDATSWTNPRGYGRYTRGLLSAIVREHRDLDLVFIMDRISYESRQFPVPVGPRYELVSTSMSPAEAATATSRRSLRDMAGVSRAITRLDLDILFFPSVFTYVPCWTRAKVLLGVHDVIAEDFPELVFPNRLNRWQWALKGWLGRLQADYLVTVSEYSRQGLARTFNWPLRRIRIVGEAPDHVFRSVSSSATAPAVLKKFGLGQGVPYLMSLGGMNPHKNMEMFLRVWDSIRRQGKFEDVRLVLAGPDESDTFTPGIGSLRRLIGQLGLEETVVVTGYISDAEAADLLRSAQAFVMPSRAEGYGLGAVEAAACGTPVIATENSPLPVLLAGGGLFIDPNDPASLEQALLRMLSDQPAREKMGARARTQASQLTWSAAAAQFYKLLQDVEAGK